MRHMVEQKPVFQNAITVVVNFNAHNVVHVEVVRLLHTLYAAVFHQVVFTGQQRPEGLDPDVRWTNCEEPWQFFDMCLVYAMVEYPESTGGSYLFLGDDTLVSNHSCPDGRRWAGYHHHEGTSCSMLTWCPAGLLKWGQHSVGCNNWLGTPGATGLTQLLITFSPACTDRPLPAGDPESEQILDKQLRPPSL